MQKTLQVRVWPMRAVKVVKADLFAEHLHSWHSTVLCTLSVVKSRAHPRWTILVPGSE